MTNIAKKEKNRGMSLIRILILGFILILVLSYFKVDIKSVVESPEGQGNISYVKETSMTIWQAYLKKPVAYLWNDIFIEIFWKSFILNMERIRDGKPTNFEEAAPTMPLTGTKP
ncbi:MAG: hypothetical protein AAB493_00715 [Patescibacteria group bacterium]